MDQSVIPELTEKEVIRERADHMVWTVTADLKVIVDTLVNQEHLAHREKRYFI